ncbi:MAG: molybdopterin cofactor-binding domain-containing protein [Elainellaceae cyanobacterium]
MNMTADSLSLQINGLQRQATCPPGTSLLSLLRQDGWMGVHRVCESGDCGSCTVWVDDVAVHSCIYPALRAEGAAVTTIEGLADDGDLVPMQQGFLQEQGFQCGYCTPGMIMTAEKLQTQDETEIRRALDGNLCRCTGYQAIVASILAGQAARTGAATATLTRADAMSSPVGQSVPKQDGPDIVTGNPVYTADWSPVGLLHLQVVRSPHAHARIRAIDTSKAEALEGVHAVFTHANIDPKLTQRAYSTAGHGAPVPDPHDHYLLDERVRFVGDRVAAVVAESVAIAKQACGLIEVDYDVLPHVIDPYAAMGDRAAEISAWSDPEATPPNPPLIHDESTSFQIDDPTHNIAGEVAMERGDVDAGFASADQIFEETYHLPAVQHFHLEPHVSTSWLEEDGQLVIRSSTQVPFHCQRLLSELFDRPIDQIRVFKAKMGGGFGNKQEILTEDLCALATLTTGRPVQWEFSRQEEFTATNSRHATTVHLRIGVKRDGSLTAMEMRAIANTGAYGNHGTQVVFLTGCMPLGLYKCPNQRFLGRSVYTNTMPAGAFRGYGATQGVFAVECLMDEIAQTLQLGSLAFKRRHLITPSDEVLIGADHHFHLLGSCGIDAVIDQVAQKLGYEAGLPAVEVDASRRRGIGFAIAMQGSGLAKIHLATVRLTLKPDGRYEMRTGSVDVGTGSDTSLRQIAAGVLNTTVEHIDLIAADTQETPFDAGSYASATLYISGEASRRAAEALRSHLLTHAAQQLDLPLESLKLQGDQVVSLQTPPLSLSLTTLTDTATEPLTVERDYAADRSSLTFAVVGAEVEVDIDTGRISVLRCIQALDIGKAINPRICEGQAVGGAVMGLGYALREELKWDDNGHMLNPHPRTYRLPLAKDVPPIEVILVEETDPYGPCGAKGIGEIGTNCAAPAIANAVAHATGLRLKELPMTPERVWKALQEKQS